MAYYLVTAKPKSDRLETLMEKLSHRTYASMRPFGKTLTYSLENARLRDDGYRSTTWRSRSSTSADSKASR